MKDWDWTIHENADTRKFPMEGYVVGRDRPHKSWRTRGMDLIDFLEYAIEKNRQESIPAKLSKTAERELLERRNRDGD